MPQAEYTGSDRASHGLLLSGILAFTLVSRLVYVPRAVMGFDGPEYINALKLDRTFNVPPPGNIGYVLLGKAFSLAGAEPVLAFALTGTLLSCIAAAYTYLFASQVLARAAALTTALAAMASPMVWYHGVIMQSYIVWMATLPAIAYYGLRLVRERTWRMVLASSLATGLSTILRPDLVIFGGPLLGACMLSAWARGGWKRKELAWFAAAGGVCAACCLVWFGITSSLLGGASNYLEAVRAKNEWHDRFGVAQMGLFEGLARNGVKYITFLIWGAGLALPLAALGVLHYALHARTHARSWLLAAAWLAPSLYFSWLIFMGNAGLILPALPLVFIAAAAGASKLCGPRRAPWVMAALAAVNVALFAFIPLRTPTDQRDALLNHMFFGYSGPGIRQTYTYQLEDFGIDRSLGNTIRQFRSPEPLPRIPTSPDN
ncbi:MAG: hypothetical protein ACK4WH_08405 [Phycisphaerales bacterium]